MAETLKKEVTGKHPDFEGLKEDYEHVDEPEEEKETAIKAKAGYEIKKFAARPSII